MHVHQRRLLCPDKFAQGTIVVVTPDRPGSKGDFGRPFQIDPGEFGIVASVGNERNVVSLENIPLPLDATVFSPADGIVIVNEENFHLTVGATASCSVMN